MKNALSNLFRWLNRLRRMLANALFALLLLLLIVALWLGRPQIPDHAALILDPKGPIVEEAALPFSGMAGFEGFAGQTALHDIERALKHAKDDDHIRLLVLKLDQMGHTPLERLQAARRAIEDFKSSGKPVIAVGPYYTQSQYYLAATADKVFLAPMGVVALHGYGVYRNYIKDALDRLHVDLHLFRAGRYKSAAEPLIRNDMSEEARSANKALLDTLWRAYKHDIAAMRGIAPERLQAILDHPSIHLARYHGDWSEMALEERLVDQIGTPAEIRETIATMLGGASDEAASIRMQDYLKAIGDEDTPADAPRIAIITASGVILDGDQPPGVIGVQPMAKMLARVRKDKQIKAVVLRIDSPGGAAAAAESIRSEIMHLRKVGKPVVVSMGSMAASGAYWIATAADQIWASPTTITGSIGAFAVLADIEQGLNKLGIHTDGLGTTNIAAGIRADRKLPAELAKVMQLAIEHVYQRFLKVVAQGRNMSVDQVEALAEGRVWSGLDGKRLGLVDHLGGLDEAVLAAAKLAKLGDSFAIVRIHRRHSLGDLLRKRLLDKTWASRLLEWLGQDAMVRMASPIPASAWADLLRYGNVWALCPLHIE